MCESLGFAQAVPIPVSGRFSTLRRPRPSSNFSCAQSSRRSPTATLSRRDVLKLFTAAPIIVLHAEDATAVTAPAATISGFEALTRSDVKRPRDDASTLLRDVVYPVALRGTWRVSSSATDVEAPAGDGLFGEAALASARAAVGGPPLVYEARFIKVAGEVVADRPFNVARIATASMGAKAVLDVTNDGPNRVAAALRPDGAAGSIFAVTLVTRSRAFGSAGGDDSPFFARELVRQVVRLGGDTPGGPPLREQIKDIETVCAYYFGDDPDVVKAVQRTLVFLSRGDPRARQTGGLPVDVRTYELTYTRLR